MLSLLYICKYEYEPKWDYVIRKVSSQDNCNAITGIKKHKQNSPMGSIKVMLVPLQCSDAILPLCSIQFF